MAESATRPRLAALPWALGTFHTVALVLILIWLVYPGGGLASLLASLGTVAGIVVFLALWAATLFTTRRALAGLDWISDEPVVMGTFFWRALRWGAVTGVLFLASIEALQLARALLAPTPGVTLGAVVLSVVLTGIVGSVVAAAIGAVIGVALGALDIAALRIARAVTR